MLSFYSTIKSIFFLSGDLIARHIFVFKTNEFFKGITLPHPDTVEPLEVKIPKESQKNPYVLDFLKVKHSA